MLSRKKNILASIKRFFLLSKHHHKLISNYASEHGIDMKLAEQIFDQVCICIKKETEKLTLLVPKERKNKITCKPFDFFKKLSREEYMYINPTFFDMMANSQNYFPRMEHTEKQKEQVKHAICNIRDIYEISKGPSHEDAKDPSIYKWLSSGRELPTIRFSDELIRAEGIVFNPQMPWIYIKKLAKEQHDLTFSQKVYQTLKNPGYFSKHTKSPKKSTMKSPFGHEKDEEVLRLKGNSADEFLNNLESAKNKHYKVIVASKWSVVNNDVVEKLSEIIGSDKNITGVFICKSFLLYQS